MTKQRLMFTFEDPNRDGVFVQVLRRVLIDKLTARQREEPFEDCSVLPGIHR